MRIYRTVRDYGQTPKTDTGSYPCGSLRRCLCSHAKIHTIAGCYATDSYRDHWCANEFPTNRRASQTCSHGLTGVANDRAVGTARRLV